MRSRERGYCRCAERPGCPPGNQGILKLANHSATLCERRIRRRRRHHARDVSVWRIAEAVRQIISETESGWLRASLFFVRVPAPRTNRHPPCSASLLPREVQRYHGRGQCKINSATFISHADPLEGETS